MARSLAPTPQVSRTSRARLIWWEIKQTLQRRILAGDLGPGAQLPTEAELAQSFGVNRHTVRRALEALSQRGLLRVEQGRGTFVRERAVAHVLARGAKISASARTSGRQLDRRMLAATLTKADQATATALGIARGEQLLKIDTLRLIDGVSIGLSANLFPMPRFRDVDRLIEEHGSVSRALNAYGVSEIFHGQTRITASAAARSDATLLGVARGSPMLVVHTLNIDRHGKPIYTGRARYAPNWVEFIVNYDASYGISERSPVR